MTKRVADLQLQSAGGQDYSVRVSPRAKRVNLTMSATDGLVVVVPKGYDLRRIPALLDLEANRRWIERASARVSAARPLPLPGVDTGGPETILLPSIGEVWVVEYHRGDDRGGRGDDREGRGDDREGRSDDRENRSDGGRSSARVVRLRQASTGNRLVLSGETNHRAACLALLRRWLRLKARRHLVRWLEDLAVELGMTFTRAAVRAQRTRWGSCSLRKSINLNVKLLFLPPELVRYVLVHELCHTVHPNHSPEFWRLVSRHEPGFRERRRVLRLAARYVPDWVAPN